MTRVRDDDVFDAVARLVAAGEYLDEIPGRPGVDVDVEGGGCFTLESGGVLRRMYTRGSRRYIEARERGWTEPLPPLQPAPLAAVESAEALAGFRLPQLLRRLYLEVGNGGFGPGCGVEGLHGGYQVDGATALSGRSWLRPNDANAPRMPRTLCHWGCAITTEIDLADGQIWGCDPNPAPHNVSPLFPQCITVTDWFERWLDGRLYQPWLVQDPATGDWRGATDVEHREAMEAAFGPEGPEA
jgi:hypothetical protein